MARLTGRDLAVFWADASGTLHIPTVRVFNPGDSFETIPYEGGTDNLRKVRLGKRRLAPSMRYVEYEGTSSGVAGTAIRERLRAGQIGTLIWGEHGTAVGSPRGAVRCSILFNNTTYEHDREIEKQVGFLPTRGTLIADPSTDTF